MAYKQNPGRGNSTKTGGGLPSPLKQTFGDKIKLTAREAAVEVAAKSDSIATRKPKNAHLFSDREKGAMGNKAANETRKFNKSDIRVEKKEVADKKVGFKDKYTKVRK